MAKKLSASEQLEKLVKDSSSLVSKARKHNKNLSGANYYANKLAEQRSAATMLYKALAVYNVGDLAALAEMIQVVFADRTEATARREAEKNLLHEIRTVWKMPPAHDTPNEADSIFPMALLTKTKRGYLSTIGAQMNGAYGEGWCDACAVMMRRLLEVSIIEAFEARGIGKSIKAPDGNYVMLTRMIDVVIKDQTLSLGRPVKLALPGLRDLGNQSAHGRYFTAQKSDIDKERAAIRLAVETFLHIARLL